MQCIPAPVVARQVVKQPFLALALVPVRELRFNRNPKELQLGML